MKAFVLSHYNAPDWVELKEVDLPPLVDDKVRIAIKAVSVNPVDFKIAKGEFALPLPRIIGIDFSGYVVECGTCITDFHPGDAVFGLADLFTQGTFAQFIDMNPAALSRMPKGISFPEAAVIPCAGITAWQAIMQKVVIPKGSSILITSGGGGVGGFAIQFARLLETQIITTASKNFERIYKLGATDIINYKNESIPDRVQEITKGKGLKTVIDLVSPESAYENAKLLRYNGSIVSIQGRPQASPFAPFTHALTLSEVALGAAYSAGDDLSLQEMAKAGEEIAALIVAKKVDPMITHIYSFEDIPEVLSQVASRQTEGKVVVTFD